MPEFRGDSGHVDQALMLVSEIKDMPEATTQFEAKGREGGGE